MSKRKNLTAAFLIVLLLGTIAVLAVSVLRQQELNTSSRALAIDITQQILSRDPQTQAPNAGALMDNAHPALLQRRFASGADGYIGMIFRTLGDLQVIENITGSSRVPLFMFSDEIPSADYSLDTVFSNGPSKVEIKMLYEQDRWLIDDFTVASELMVF
ncbi:MAG: hypothetical protein WDZ52_09460 [Pseudohongiellaceae bacterium]